MKVALIISLLILLPTFLGIGFSAAGALGEMLEALYLYDKAAWANEGSPTVFTWTPPEDEFNQGNISGVILSIKLMFNTPTWLPIISGGDKILRRLRILSALNFATMIAILILFLRLLGHLPAA